MTVFNARALASLVTVAGNALSKRLNVVLTSLVKELESQTKTEETELKSALEEALQALLQSISDAEGLNTLMMVLLGWSVIYLVFPPLTLGALAKWFHIGQNMNQWIAALVLAISWPASVKFPKWMIRYIASIGSDNLSRY